MAQWYAGAMLGALNKEVDWDSDDFRLLLVSSSYTPNRLTHQFASDLGATELATGGGYTAGGWALTEVAPALTAANSWAATWAASAAVETDYVVRPTTGNSYLYRCVVAGTTGSTQPTWPTTVGASVVDNGVTWENVGVAAIVIDAADVTQASFTAGPFRYGVIADYTPGTAATRRLIGLIDFGSDQSGNGGTFTLAFDAQGLLHIFFA